MKNTILMKLSQEISIKTLFLQKVLTFSIFILFVSYHVYSQNPIDYYNSARVSYFNDDYNRAVDLLNEALKLNPNYIDALELIARVYFDSGKYDYAFNNITKAVSLAPQRTDLIIFSADIETKLKRFNIAESKYKRIIENDPLNVSAFNGLANLYLLTDRKILARNTLISILKSDPGNAEALLKLSHYYEDSDPSKALEYYQINVRNNSLNPEVYYNYSLFQFRQRKIREALDSINTSIEIKNDKKYKKLKATYLLYLNRPDEAIDIYKEVLTGDKSDNKLYYNLARAYYKINDVNNVISSLSKAVSLRPDDEISAFFLDEVLLDNHQISSPLRVNRAAFYFQKSMEAKRGANFDLYLFYLRKAVILNPSNDQARYELASYYKNINFPERYLRELNIIYDITKSKNIKDMIDMESRSLVYRLGEEWGINQYNVEGEVSVIPLFINYDIKNEHYNYETIYADILRNLSFSKYKYELLPHTDREYERNEKMSIAQKGMSGYYLDLYVSEKNNMVEVELNLNNAVNAVLLYKFGTYQFGNDKLVITSSTILRKIDEVIPFRARIVKISQDRALINAGRRQGVRLRDGYYIIENKRYSLLQGKTAYQTDKNDIKGTGIVVKVDENISEIRYKDKGFFKSINVGDLIILIE